MSEHKEMGEIYNHTFSQSIDIFTLTDKENGDIVGIAQSLGSMRFQFGMTKAQAIELAGALAVAAGSIEGAI